MSATYGDLKARVASEIKRSDQSASIVCAIGRAIEHYASKRFWFNVGRKTGAAVADTEYADVAAGMRQADGVYVTIGGQEMELRRVPFSELEALLGSLQATGQPNSYANLGPQIRLYPRPDQAYPLTWIGLVDLAALSADSDSNAWTDPAQDLIAAHAAGYIYTTLLEDPDAAAACALREQQAWSRLQRDTALRDGDGGVEAF